MPAVYFNKISEHTAEINNAPAILWKVSTIAGQHIQANKIYYVRANHVHATLGREYWCDSRKLISTDKVVLPDERIPDKKPMQQQPNLFQQIQCGQCNRVNIVNIDTLVQGAHNCTQCRSTICIIIGKNITLKNASKALNTQRGR